MDTLLKDLRYGIKILLKHPAFAAVAVLSIAFGIGVNTTIFSFINAALFRPLPFPESHKLVRVWDGNYPDYVAYRDDSVFSGLAAYAQRPSAGLRAVVPRRRNIDDGCQSGDAFGQEARRRTK